MYEKRRYVILCGMVFIAFHLKVTTDDMHFDTTYNLNTIIKRESESSSFLSDSLSMFYFLSIIIGFLMSGFIILLLFFFFFFFFFFLLTWTRGRVASGVRVRSGIRHGVRGRIRGGIWRWVRRGIW